MDQNPGLSDIDRMNYLTGLLRGEGARAISGLALTNSNYTKALELLKSRFGQNQALINSYMDALVKMQSPTCDVKKLGHFFDSCESYIRGLEALDIKTESYGNLLVPIVLKKPPEEIRRLLLRSNEHAGSSLTELRVALRSILIDVARPLGLRYFAEQATTKYFDSCRRTSSRNQTCERSHMPTSVEPTSSPDTPPPSARISTAGALMSGVSRDRNNCTKCVYCNGPHKPEKCEAEFTVEHRLNTLRRQRRSFRYLKMYHVTTKLLLKNTMLRLQWEASCHYL